MLKNRKYTEAERRQVAFRELSNFLAGDCSSERVGSENVTMLYNIANGAGEEMLSEAFQEGVKSGGKFLENEIIPEWPTLRRTEI